MTDIANTATAAQTDTPVSLATAASELHLSLSTLQHRSARERMGLVDCPPPPFVRSTKYTFVSRTSLDAVKQQRQLEREFLRGVAAPTAKK